MLDIIVFIVFVDEFLFVFMKVVNVAFFSKQGLEVVSGLNFLLMCEEDSMGIGEEGV